VVWEPRIRSNILVNRGESQYGAGRSATAIRDYREAIRISSSPDHQALAHYGLGIARAQWRSAGALGHAHRREHPASAVGQRPRSPGVFFVPAYDKHYYRALGAMALPERSQAGRAARGARTRTGRMAGYLLDAERDGHRGSNARLHLASIEKELKRLPAPKR
jgi:hypothetical protein